MEKAQGCVHGPGFAVEQWKAAAACGPNGGNCVEVNHGVAGMVGVRDSKCPGGPALVFRAGGWRSFLAGQATGSFG
jgi:hypothetical protein